MHNNGTALFSKPFMQHKITVLIMLKCCKCPQNQDIHSLSFKSKCSQGVNLDGLTYF